MAVNDDDHNLQFFMIAEWDGWSRMWWIFHASVRAVSVCQQYDRLEYVTPKRRL